MKVAFDLRPLQIGHQYRGIGICLQNILKELQNSPVAVKGWDLVFYIFENQPKPEILKNYTLPHRILTTEETKPRNSRLRIVRYLNGMYASWRKASSIDRLPEINDIDIFVQFDFLLGVPKPSNLKTVLLKYDIIPLVLEGYYLPTYRQVKNKTNSINQAIRAHRHRIRYLLLLKRALERADLVLAISEHTKLDLITYLKTNKQKIKVLHLAADNQSFSTSKVPAYRLPSLDWRFIKGQERYRTFDLLHKPYLLYVGGVDPRRKLSDLIAAYNILKSENIDCCLVLIGYDFQNIATIPNEKAKKSIQSSSYGNDIYFLGFVSPEEKNLLYENALAFVYPTLYEGFGIPVLEAMENNCPVICYDNSSLREVGGSSALYARSVNDIVEITKDLISNKKHLENIRKAGLQQSKNFNWAKTTKLFIKNITG